MYKILNYDELFFLSGELAWLKVKLVSILKAPVPRLSAAKMLAAIVMTPIFTLYSRPLNNLRVVGTDPPHSEKYSNNFGLPQNLTTKSQLLTGSLMDNIKSQLTHIL